MGCLGFPHSSLSCFSLLAAEVQAIPGLQFWNRGLPFPGACDQSLCDFWFSGGSRFGRLVALPRADNMDAGQMISRSHQSQSVRYQCWANLTSQGWSAGPGILLTRRFALHSKGFYARKGLELLGNISRTEIGPRQDIACCDRVYCDWV